MFYRVVFLSLILCFPVAAEPTTPAEIARKIIAPLIDPAKIATLKGARPINARTYRLLYWLETARRAGGDPAEVVALAQTVAGYAGTVAAKEDKAAIVSNRSKLEVLGCFTAQGMADLRKGASPDITKGFLAGSGIELDHILPVSIVPELANRYFNLYAMSAQENRTKGAKIGKRELELARRWHKEGLLSAEGLQAAIEAGKR